MRATFLTLLLLISFMLVAQAPFVTVWKTNNAGVSNNNQVKIPGTGNYVVNWVEIDNASNSGTLSASGHQTITFPSAGTYRLSITGGLTRIRFNGNDDAPKIINIENWGDIAWTSFAQAFKGCINLQLTATDAPDLSGVTNLASMFTLCDNLDGPVNHWETDQVTNMDSIFFGATRFNQPLDNWEVGKVTRMKALFFNAQLFNQPIGNWDMRKVGTILGIFGLANDFNQYIGDWQFENLVWTIQAFAYAEDFNQDISGWDVSKVRGMGGMFERSGAFNQDLSDWDVGMVWDFNAVFKNARAFDQNLKGWDISSAGDLEEIFKNSALSSANYDATLIAWSYKNVRTNLELGATGLEFCTSRKRRDFLIDQKGWSFTGDELNCDDAYITRWKTDNEGASFDYQFTLPATSKFSAYWEKIDDPTKSGTVLWTGERTFSTSGPGTYRLWVMGDFKKVRFNDEGDPKKILAIEQWGTISWSSMESAYEGCTNLLYEATDVPDLSDVTDFTAAFRFCKKLNGDLSSWDVSSVRKMEEAFFGATRFNGDVSGWNVSNVNDFSSMFSFASGFNRNLGGWNLSSATTLRYLLDLTDLSTENYDATLIGWAAAATTPGNLNFGARNLSYCDGANARNQLISDGWTINNDDLSPDCQALPLNLFSFSCQADGKYNILEWSTSNETAFSHFEIQRSDNGGDEWQTLGAAAGAEEGLEEQGEYAFTDEQPLHHSYYRLKMIDLDGTHAYSNVVYLEREAAAELLVYPNPNTGSFTIILPLDQVENVTLYDLTGRKIWARPLAARAGISQARISSVQTIPGIYLLVATGMNGTRWTERVVVR